MVIMQKAAKKIRKYLVVSPSPNHRIASGIQAMGGMGRTISIMGLKIASTRGYQPMVTPKVTPRTAAIRKPVNTRDKLHRICPKMV